MTRVLVLIAMLCAASSCTFTHAALARHDHPPAVQLSPAMTKLAHEQSRTPTWCALGDIALVMGGFAAGPTTENETANLAGFAVTGLTMLSLAATLALWGDF